MYLSAMYNITFTYFVIVMFGIAAASDQNYWMEQAEKNAKRNLDQWPSTVDGFISGNNLNLMRNEIGLFRTQVGDGIDNLHSFVPKLKSVVVYTNSTAAASRGVLHSIVWYIRGRRDNKSYYLLDGAANWVAYRLSELASKGDRAREMEQKLIDAKNHVANLRDELDSVAQNYLRSIGKIDELIGNFNKNIEEIRILANGLAIAFKQSQLLKNADDVNNLVRAIIV